MTTIREAFDAMGFTLKEGETVCISFGEERFKEYSLFDVADREIGANVYFSTGTFPIDTKWKKGARVGDRVMRTLEIPFDFDLKDFLGIEDKAEIASLSDEEIQSYIAIMQKSVETIFRQIGLTIHRLDYTGYGLSAHVVLQDNTSEHSATIRKHHAAIVTEINNIFGGELADIQVKDAGPRIMRLVPCTNAYIDDDGVIYPPRQSRNIYKRSGAIDQATLETVTERFQITERENIVRLYPPSGEGIDASLVTLIIDTLKPYWSQGQRHFLALALGGYLAKAMVPESQATEIIKAISTSDNDQFDRTRAIKDSYEKARHGVQVSGWYPLSSMIDGDDLDAIDQQLEAHKKSHGPRLIVNGKAIESGTDRDDKDRPVTFDEYPEPPAEAEYGWFGRYVDLVYPTTEASRGFHLVAGLTAAGAACGRRIALEYSVGTIFPNQYNLLVGPTGSSRKGTAMKLARNLPTYRTPDANRVSISPFTVIRNMGSGAAVVKTLKENPNTLLSLEEATTLFNNMHRQGGEELLDKMIEAWDVPDSLEDNVKNNPNTAIEPYLSMIAGIQPGRLEEALGANEIESGLANRMGIFFGVRRRIIPLAPQLDKREAQALYAELRDAVMSYPDGERLKIDRGEAENHWNEFYIRHSSQKGTEDENAMRIRHPEMALKWALLFAITDRDQAIRLHHLKAAIAIQDWMWEGIKRRLPTWGVSIDKKIEELVFQALRQHGVLPRRILQMKTSRRQWSGREFAAVFQAMVQNGHLKVDANNNVALAEMLEEQARKDRGAA